MTTDTMTLTGFLLARIAEDEESARLPPGAQHWRQVEDVKERHWGLTLTFACPTCHQAPGEACVAMTPPTRSPRPASGLHGTRQDLARASAQAMRWHSRVLAECEAKRRIVERLAVPDPHEPDEDCQDCFVLYVLASVYADHPDYREEWKP